MQNRNLQLFKFHFIFTKSSSIVCITVIKRMVQTPSFYLANTEFFITSAFINLRGIHSRNSQIDAQIRVIFYIIESSPKSDFKLNCYHNYRFKSVYVYNKTHTLLCCNIITVTDPYPILITLPLQTIYIYTMFVTMVRSFSLLLL